MTKLPFAVEHPSRNVHVVRTNIEQFGGWEQWFLLSSDRHHDNAHTDHKLETKHLKQAVERGAGIIDVGDTFCAMQGKWDKRSDLTACRPEQQEGRYLDSLVKCAADFYTPYAKNYIVIGRGNHETSILKRHETDLTERLCERMSVMSGHHVQAGGYGGWVRFCFKKNKKASRFNMKYFHGSGGGGPVTRGVIQTNRLAVYLPDADIVCGGHTHDQWCVPIARERILDNNTISTDEQLHIRIGTYKDEYGDGWGGWHIERGGVPKPIGAMWLRFYAENKTIKVEAIAAK